MRITRTRPILVTGSHRCGSTWVGRMLASHPRVGYVEEPFNALIRPRCPVRHQWHHVTEADAEQFIAYLRGSLEFEHHWWAEVKERPTLRRLVGATLRALQALRQRHDGSRPLMKDPIAFFSAEWLAATFDMDVIVLIRHPAAFTSSLKRLRWAFPFQRLLEQPRLMETYLEPFRAEIERISTLPPDLIEQGILLWRIFHHVILCYQRTHPEWIFCRHEDLALRPVDEFRKLLVRLGLDFPVSVLRAIEEHSAEENPAAAPDRVIHQLKRNSKASIWNWRTILQPDEIARIRQGTEDLACLYYTDADWQPPAQARAA